MGLRCLPAPDGPVGKDTTNYFCWQGSSPKSSKLARLVSLPGVRSLRFSFVRQHKICRAFFARFFHALKRLYTRGCYLRLVWLLVMLFFSCFEATDWRRGRGFWLRALRPPSFWQFCLLQSHQSSVYNHFPFVKTEANINSSRKTSIIDYLPPTCLFAVRSRNAIHR